MMKEFLKVIHYEEAVEKLITYRPFSEIESVNIADCCNRIAAQDVCSSENLPAFHRSTVDGYAVIAEDIYGCSETSPGFLQIIGEITMGQSAAIKLQKGQCCWIPTGGMLPEGANAVIMVENTDKLDDRTILAFHPVSLYENVMQSGEDIKIGQRAIKKGTVIRPADIGLLASLGIASMEVVKPYKVGIISTGDEIVEIEQKPKAGEIRDVNSHALYAAVKSCGALPFVYPLVRDQFDDLKQAVEGAIKENHILLISGGSSVGIMDATLEVLMSFPEAQMLFHGIAIKPGKPTLAVKIGEKLVIGLPGHPVSALTNFYILIRPLLIDGPIVNSLEGYLKLNIASQAGRDDFIPAVIEERDGQKMIRPLLGKSGLMSILSQSQGYIHIPYEQQGLKAGEKVKVIIY